MMEVVEREGKVLGGALASPASPTGFPQAGGVGRVKTLPLILHVDVGQTRWLGEPAGAKSLISSLFRVETGCRGLASWLRVARVCARVPSDTLPGVSETLDDTGAARPLCDPAREGPWDIDYPIIT